ncbi:MAG: 50S ribosomal protein L24 [Candidatus Kerfeldbacteria bacterium]|nr:50S ribosomal protein L24 [Candidatus Kerfeldbacteria bacterium]
MKLKTGDLVKIMKGKDSGKTGKLVQVLPVDHKVVVEGLHKIIKHLKPRKQGEKGQRFEFSAPMAAANVQIVCPKCNTITRVGMQILADGKKQRICRKCNNAL